MPYICSSVYRDPGANLIFGDAGNDDDELKSFAPSFDSTDEESDYFALGAI